MQADRFGPEFEGCSELCRGIVEATEVVIGDSQILADYDTDRVARQDVLGQFGRLIESPQPSCNPHRRRDYVEIDGIQRQSALDVQCGRWRVILDETFD